MKRRKTTKYKYFMGDFETTVYDGQIRTDVWASAVVEFWTEDVTVLHSIGETWDFLKKQKGNVCIYYHNLKFDGAFWMDYFLTELQMPQAVENPDAETPAFLERWEMPNGTFEYAISDQGQWYSFTIRQNNRFIEIRDSLKLLPFSVRKIGKDFKTKHQKLDMEYKGFRYPGCVITPEEEQYIKNDVLVVKEALEILHGQGHSKLTIGACCLSEFKASLNQFGNVYKDLFPNLYDVLLDPDVFGASNADEYIRHSYHGGWTYLVPEKAQKIFAQGLTADVNSLYPSMMHSESGNAYPVGKPAFWSGPEIPEEAKKPHHFYFVRFRCRFRIKEGFLPFVQIKSNVMYNPREMLTTSDFWDKKQNRYVQQMHFPGGVVRDSHVILTMTETDFELFLKHYDVFDLQIMDGCFFKTLTGIFDEYINKYRKIKEASVGALRALAKLFLNNLYGKMAASVNSSFKFVTVEGEKLAYNTIEDDSKTPGFIAIGSAITAYARRFTITAAQKNYHGPLAPGFIYADTDSIHCDLQPEDLQDVPIHETAFCHWKIENRWDQGWFVRPKTYIEHTIEKDGEACEPFYMVKCAGMPDSCKANFLKTMKNVTDFTYGLKVPGKLMPKRVPGGVVLVDTVYEMKKGFFNL